MAPEPLRTPFERCVGVTLKTLIFVTFLWGTAIVLAGHYVLLHPSRHISSLLPPYGIFSNLSASNSGNGDLLAGHVDSSLLGDPLRFHLDPKWDIHAAPTTRVYNWTVSEIWGKPGHINKRMLVVNGMSPGPTIEANFGDRIIVNVVNLLENATAIHWHGQFQNGTNFYDGTFGITQCGIPPNGGQMTYNFTVQNIGTYWWHAHYSTQRTDGLYGAMVLHSPDEPAQTTVPYDEEIVLLLSDLYNTYSQDLLWRYHRYGTGINGQPGDEPVGDGGSVNGISQARCAYTPATDSTLPERRHLHRRQGQREGRERRRLGSTRNPGGQLDQPVIHENNTCVWEGDDQYATFELRRGRSYRLRLVNAGSLSGIFFSIDHHSLLIVEADGVSVEPRRVDKVFISPAQRYSVIVKLDQEPSSYWIRSTLHEEQLRYTGPNLNVTTLGILRYDGTSTDVAERGPPSLPPSRDSTIAREFTQPPDYLNDLVPIPHLVVPEANRKVTLTVSMQYTSDGDHLSFFNYTSWSPLEDSATLFLTQASLSFPSSFSSVSTSPPSTYSDLTQLTITSHQPETIDIILNNLDDGAHPFHLHGHTFFIMASGAGRWMAPEIASKFHLDPNIYQLRTRNPMRRDTVLVPAFSFVVLRFTSDNPGLWAFHCHITWHLESGLMMQFASYAGQGLEKLEIPPELVAACPTSGRSVEKVDGG